MNQNLLIGVKRRVVTVSQNSMIDEAFGLFKKGGWEDDC